MENKISEEKLQAECFTWFWNTYPKLRRTLFAVPNGGARNKMEASRMKATGTVAGVSDLIWVLPDQVIFIEMKTKTGAQSKEQKEFEAMVGAHGHDYVIIRSADEFRALIFNLLR